MEHTPLLPESALAAHPSVPRDWRALHGDYAMATADLDDLGTDYTNDEADFYCDALVEARDCLMFAPAPDGAALIHKLEIYLSEEMHSLDADSQRRLLNAFIADVRRLTRGASNGQ